MAEIGRPRYDRIRKIFAFSTGPTRPEYADAIRWRSLAGSGEAGARSGTAAAVKIDWTCAARPTLSIIRAMLAKAIQAVQNAMKRPLVQVVESAGKRPATKAIAASPNRRRLINMTTATTKTTIAVAAVRHPVLALIRSTAPRAIAVPTNVAPGTRLFADCSTAQNRRNT